MFKRFLFLLFSILSCTSCNKKTVFTEAKINNQYIISVPEYMQRCSDLHKDASFQYQNSEKEIYALVIDEKKEMMKDYNLNNIASQPFLETIKEGKVSIPGRQHINGNNALVAEITGKIDQNNVYYKLGVIETPYAFYQILIWTLAENKEKLEPDMIKMIESFKELPIPKEKLPNLKLNDSILITTPG